ncbi:MAG: hypothetical protein NTV34_17395 [Proteobacteria bacterium]|nr:hypothetical protein [Pseudomonadota bacterium]
MTVASVPASLALFLVSTAVFASGGIVYWDRSYSCQGPPAGLILVDLNGGNPVCKRFSLNRNSPNRHIWAVKIDGTCVELGSDPTAKEFCENYLLD